MKSNILPLEHPDTMILLIKALYNRPRRFFYSCSYRKYTIRLILGIHTQLVADGLILMYNSSIPVNYSWILQTFEFLKIENYMRTKCVGEWKGVAENEIDQYIFNVLYNSIYCTKLKRFFSCSNTRQPQTCMSDKDLYTLQV